MFIQTLSTTNDNTTIVSGRRIFRCSYIQLSILKYVKINIEKCKHESRGSSRAARQGGGEIIKELVRRRNNKKVHIAKKFSCKNSIFWSSTAKIFSTKISFSKISFFEVVFFYAVFTSTSWHWPALHCLLCWLHNTAFDLSSIVARFFERDEMKSRKISISSVVCRIDIKWNGRFLNLKALCMYSL